MVVPPREVQAIVLARRSGDVGFQILTCCGGARVCQPAQLFFLRMQLITGTCMRWWGKMKDTADDPDYFKDSLMAVTEFLVVIGSLFASVVGPVSV